MISKISEKPVAKTGLIYTGDNLELITKGTIEEKIYKLQERKKDLSDSVIQSGEVFINKLTIYKEKRAFSQHLT